MSIHFDYKYEEKAQESIDIEDIGKVCLQAFSDFGETWILIVRTTQGISEVITYGPVNCDVEELPESSSYDYSRFTFNQQKLQRIIDKFINMPLVSQVMEKSFREVKGVIVSFADRLQGEESTNNDESEEADDDFDKLF